MEGDNTEQPIKRHCIYEAPNGQYTQVPENLFQLVLGAVTAQYYEENHVHNGLALAGGCLKENGYYEIGGIGFKIYEL